MVSTSMLLTPVGEHRHEIDPSRGRRWKKRKRKRSSSLGIQTRASVTPIPPDISKHLTVGFNSTARALETMCKVPSAAINEPLSEMATEKIDRKQAGKPSKLVAVFVCRSILPVSLLAPLSSLVASASQTLPPEQKIRLVCLPKGSETQLSAAVGVPRVCIVGVAQCSSASILVEYVRHNVPAVEFSGMVGS
uniref:Uncharacterized protein n=1 Tax=Coccidioides posadasii RMSCC 3488 TaxID=454284 RepID=A0A0J6F679_COCPO|nr:hypothetical protein CPAG_02019 [Coccidioides posadasii RMSCC 3488]